MLTPRAQAALNHSWQAQYTSENNAAVIMVIASTMELGLRSVHACEFPL